MVPSANIYMVNHNTELILLDRLNIKAEFIILNFSLSLSIFSQLILAYVFYEIRKQNKKKENNQTKKFAQLCENEEDGRKSVRSSASVPEE